MAPRVLPRRVPDRLRLARGLLAAYTLVLLHLNLGPLPAAAGAPGRLDLVGHFAMFLVFGLLVGASLPRLPVAARLRATLLLGLLAGLVLEAAQTRVPGRMFDLADLVANWAGASAAVLVLPLRGPQGGAGAPGGVAGPDEEE